MSPSGAALSDDVDEAEARSCESGAGDVFGKGAGGALAERPADFDLAFLAPMLVVRLESGSLPSKLLLEPLRREHDPFMDAILLLFSLLEESSVESRFTKSLEGISSEVADDDDLIPFKLLRLRGCNGILGSDPVKVPRAILLL